ncbi:hypothetical protein E2542_SST20443 [Spatholobus suberectus]|nr:hypothetical protein E2542_SST20443 [Spatholobus suberectus]
MRMRECGWCLAFSNGCRSPVTNTLPLLPCIALDTMANLPYIGSQPSNVDILVHFTKKINQPNKIRNIDLDMFKMFNAHDTVNLLAKDEGLQPCYPFRLWRNGTSKIIPLENDSDVLKMFSENENATYVHIDGVECVDAHVDKGEVLVNEEVHVNYLDEVYASDEDNTFNRFESLSGSFDNEFDLVDKAENENDGSDNDRMNDFEETIDVIGNVHSNYDMTKLTKETMLRIIVTRHSHHLCGCWLIITHPMLELNVNKKEDYPEIDPPSLKRLLGRLGGKMM